MAAVDPRVQQYAKLIVERSVDVQPGWQVMVNANVVGRPLIEEVVRLIARRGAYPLVRLSWIDSEQVPFECLWGSEAPVEMLPQMAPIEALEREQVDAQILIWAAENTRAATLLPADRRAELRKASAAWNQRRLSGDFRWVGCLYPTDALAQEAAMPLATYEDFVYGATLLDWDAEGARMRRYADRFDVAETVRIVGPGTDLTFSLAGRTAVVDDGHYNMPGGEFFTSPVEDSAEGEVVFGEFPAVYNGREVRGIRLRFEGGKVVDAAAEGGEDYLLEQLDRDEGARRLGELGIGCNPGITRHMKNTLFDEKMDGTVHLALGNGLPDVGGENVSQIHWDIVKEMRAEGSRIELDGKPVQESGRWLV